MHQLGAALMAAFLAPQCLQGGLDLKPASTTALSLSSAFVNYAPCLISDDAIGAAATAVGINIAPQVSNTICNL